MRDSSFYVVATESAAVLVYCRRKLIVVSLVFGTRSMAAYVVRCSSADFVCSGDVVQLSTENVASLPRMNITCIFFYGCKWPITCSLLTCIPWNVRRLFGIGLWEIQPQDGVCICNAGFVVHRLIMTEFNLMLRLS